MAGQQHQGYITRSCLPFDPVEPVENSLACSLLVAERLGDNLAIEPAFLGRPGSSDIACVLGGVSQLKGGILIAAHAYGQHVKFRFWHLRLSDRRARWLPGESEIGGIAAALSGSGNQGDGLIFIDRYCYRAVILGIRGRGTILWRLDFLIAR